MQITHIAGIDLASDGWQIVADPMLAGNAGDNWQQTELGLLADYPRSFTLTLLTSSPSRATIEQRVTTLLSDLDARRDYRITSDAPLRMQVTHNTTTYFVAFQITTIRGGMLQWTGSAYTQTITIEGFIAAPPFAQTNDTVTFLNILPFNPLNVTFPSSPATWWAPGTINVSASWPMATFGGIWVAETERGAPAAPMALRSIPNTTPSSTAITIGAYTARWLTAPGTYTVNFPTYIASWTPYDVWIHASGNATIEMRVNNVVLAKLTITPYQLCYYAGRVYGNVAYFSATIVVSSSSAVIYPLLLTHVPSYRAIVYIPSQAIPTFAGQVLWSNPLIDYSATVMREVAVEKQHLMVGSVDCWLPRACQFVATWRAHEQLSGVEFVRHHILPGVL